MERVTEHDFFELALQAELVQARHGGVGVARHDSGLGVGMRTYSRLRKRFQKALYTAHVRGEGETLRREILALVHFHPT
jgi:hypothetical protein